MSEEEPSYKIKFIQWPPGASSPRRVGVLCQDINGPCPLIAIINVLLLRGAVSLPAGVGEITQVTPPHSLRPSQMRIIHVSGHLHNIIFYFIC